MENSPPPPSSHFLLSDLSRFKTREEVIRFISSSLTSIDTDCALHNTSSKIKESTNFLLEADAIMGAMTTKFDVQLLQQTWKRLIAFYKSYHLLITSEQVDRITKVLHRRACYFINALCAQNVAEKNMIFSQEAQQRNYSSMVSNLQSLSFYCQRISASMAYFSNNFEHDALQMSMDILFFFRGFLSYYPSSPSIITKSEEFFRKALRSPFTATNEETNSSSDHSIDQNDDFSRVAKRSRSITDSDTVSHSVNELSSMSSPFEKFDSAVRRKNRLCCSSFNEECREGDSGDLTAHCLSLGICSLATSELEKLSLERSDPIPIPILIPTPVPVPIPDSIGSCDAVGVKHRGNTDRQGTVLVLLDIFLFSIQKICISYNCIGSDLSITDAIKHFLDAFLCYLDSTKGTGSSCANAAISILIAQSCNGHIKDKVRSHIARHLLCKVLGSVSCRSQCCVAESLWGVYSAIARRRKKALSSGIKSTTEQSLRRSHVNADVDFSGHLTAASLTIRHFLCTAHLEAVYALLQRVIRSFDCCVAPSRPVSPDGPAAVKNGEGDSGDQGGLCLEALLRALPLSTLTARCREMCDSERRSSQPADADPSQRNVPLGMSTDSVASSSGQILTLLGRLVNDACALLSAEESDNSMTVSNGILVSAYNTAICVTVLTAASTSATTSASVSVSASTSGSRTSISVPQSLLRRVSAINRYLRGVCSRGGKPKELPVKYCEVRKISAVINAQQALVAALETALSSSERSFASQSVPKSQHHSQSQPSGRQDVRPHLSHAELKALKDSALSMLSACDYLSHRSTASQMFSSADPLLAARPPTMTSTALRAVKCVCQALGLILSFIETVTKETFELAKLCFHTMMKAASAFSQILQCCESRLASSHHFSKTSALTPTTSALVARMDVAAMWSTILSFLVKLAKGLPPSLQSGAQTLVPQKALSLVQAASRGSSGSVHKVISSSSDSSITGSLVVLSGVTRARVAAAISTLYTVSLSPSLSLSGYDETQSNCSVGCTSLHGLDEDSEARSVKRLKASAYRCANCSNSDSVVSRPKLPHFRIISGIENDKDKDSDISAAERGGVLGQLGLSCCPLDSSFEDAALLCPTGHSHGHSHSHGAGPQGSGFIPVLQAVVSDTSSSVGTVSLTHLQPTRSNCQFVLLLLPAVNSSTLSTQADAFYARPDKLDLHPRIALRSTGSVAFIQLGE